MSRMHVSKYTVGLGPEVQEVEAEADIQLQLRYQARIRIGRLGEAHQSNVKTARDSLRFLSSTSIRGRGGANVCGRNSGFEA